MRLGLRSVFWKSIFRLAALILTLLIISFSNTKEVLSVSNMSTDEEVIEHLRLHVPKEEKRAWLEAEKASWEPWLMKQRGFLERKLFWDPNKEEALLLISWANRSDWKTIPQAEIDRVQNLFEEVAMELTEKYFANPFPIKSQGEFLPQ